MSSLLTMGQRWSVLSKEQLENGIFALVFKGVEIGLASVKSIVLHKLVSGRLQKERSHKLQKKEFDMRFDYDLIIVTHINHPRHHFIPITQIRDVEIIMLDDFENDSTRIIQAQGIQHYGDELVPQKTRIVCQASGFDVIVVHYCNNQGISLWKVQKIGSTIPPRTKEPSCLLAPKTTGFGSNSPF